MSQEFNQDYIISSSQNIDINQIWEDAKKILAEKMTAISFDVWINTISPVEIKGNALVLATPSLSSKKMLLKSYKTKIAGA